MTVDARRLTGAALIASVVAVVAIVLGASGSSETTTESDEGWIVGLLLVFGPVIAAGAARSVAASSLLRGIGIPATVFAALTAIVHVGVAVDDRGAVGWLVGAPAALTVVFLIAAMVAGPARPPATETAAPSPVPPPEPTIEGPPLDVVGALRGARRHAVAEVGAWIVVLVVGALVTPLALLVAGWPKVVDTLDARVASIDEDDVTFVADHDGRTLTWSYEWSEDSQWEVGERRRVHLDDDGRVHVDAQLGLAGFPMFASLFVALFLLFALRRLWGLVVALVDAGRGDDQPRLGYVALVRPYRSWRPLAAVWWRDPTRGEALERPDAVYRADDEAAEELHADSPAVAVHLAWVDTGWRPRWIAADGGVVVPHRRALLGRWHFRLLTKRSEVGDVVGLHHAAPVVGPVGSESVGEGGRHRIGPMIAWRLLAVPVSLAIPLVSGPGGEVARQLG